MRWPKKIAKIGDKRIIEKFAFLPITIDNEARWLETVTIEQKYIKSTLIAYPSGTPLACKYVWNNEKFIDRKTQKYHLTTI